MEISINHTKGMSLGKDGLELGGFGVKAVSQIPHVEG